MIYEIQPTLSPPVCSKCENTGYTLSANGAVPCSCLLEKQRMDEIKNSNLPRRFCTTTLEGLEPKFPAQRTAINAVQKYLRDFTRTTDTGLLIYGYQGCGKSMLAAGLLHDLVCKGISGRWLNAPDYMQAMRDANFSTDREEAARLLQRARRTNLLVIDDLCAEDREDLTAYSIDQLYLLVNGRYEDATPLVITTNLKPERLKDKLKARLFSRLCEMCQMIPCIGPDLRQRAE